MQLDSERRSWRVSGYARGLEQICRALSGSSNAGVDQSSRNRYAMECSVVNPWTSKHLSNVAMGAGGDSDTPRRDVLHYISAAECEILVSVWPL